MLLPAQPRQQSARLRDRFALADQCAIERQNQVRADDKTFRIPRGNALGFQFRQRIGHGTVALLRGEHGILDRIFIHMGGNDGEVHAGPPQDFCAARACRCQDQAGHSVSRPRSARRFITDAAVSSTERRDTIDHRPFAGLEQFARHIHLGAHRIQIDIRCIAHLPQSGEAVAAHLGEPIRRGPTDPRSAAWSRSAIRAGSARQAPAARSPRAHHEWRDRHRSASWRCGWRPPKPLRPRPACRASARHHGQW